VRTLALAALFFFATPGLAAADVIFDPADADELASVLAEATAEQGVCYGWNVSVDNVGVPEDSVGSNRGAGIPVDSACAKHVRLDVRITYTSESSESEDSASYDVSSSAGGPTRADLDALDLDWDGLTGEDPDAVIGKAVTALPLLAADKGMAKPIAAAPETGAAPADAQLTDDPGSDWWRGSGGAVLWGVGLLLAGGLFAWWVLRTNRARRRTRPEAVPAYVPDTVPEDFYELPEDPDLAPADKPTTKPAATEPEPKKPEPVDSSTAEKALDTTAHGSEATATEESAAGEPAPEGPVAGEPAPEESVAGEPTTEGSVAGEPATEGPAAGEPTTEESAATPRTPAEQAEGTESTESPPPSESTKDTSSSGESGDAKPAAPSDQKDKE
jgi:hypothetical protein